MNWEKELNQELKKLRKSFHEMFIKSPDFKRFKKRLREMNLESDVFLAMFIVGEERKSNSKGRVKGLRRKNNIKLAKEDVNFLKANGLRWE